MNVVRTTEELLVELIEEVRSAKGSSDAVTVELGKLVEAVNGYKAEVESLRKGVPDQIDNRVRHALDHYLPIRPARVPTNSG